MAAHGNDPVAHLHDILAYQDAILEVKNFVDSQPATVMISVSDHETGGISVGHQLGSTYPKYEW
jgi:alkaline phosphatase